VHQVPDGLAALVEHYRGKAQAAVPFYPRTWEQAVDDIRPRSTGALLHAAGPRRRRWPGGYSSAQRVARVTQQSQTNRKLAPIAPFSGGLPL